MVHRGWLYLGVAFGLLSIALSLSLALVASYVIGHDDVWPEMGGRGYTTAYYVSELFALGSGLLIPALITVGVFGAWFLAATRREIAR